MEDVFALNLISNHSIIHLLAFLQNFEHYLKGSFIVELFRHMYSKLFELIDRGSFKENSIVDVPYDLLSAKPEETLKMIYDRLELEGFEEALPDFREHIASVDGYVKNKFELEDRLRNKVNEKLGFYFERYGYERR